MRDRLLRHLFAGFALAGMLAANRFIGPISQLVKRAYEMADAMVAEGK